MLCKILAKKAVVTCCARKNDGFCEELDNDAVSSEKSFGMKHEENFKNTKSL